MADLTADYPLQAQGDYEIFTAIIADAVTLYHGALVGIEGGYANHWADGAADTFGGYVLGGDTTLVNDQPALLGDITPPTGRTAARVRIAEGAILTGLKGLLGPGGGAVVQADVGKPVYCPTSNPEDMTMVVTGANHVIGVLDDFRSATDVDVRLLTRAEMTAQKVA